MRRPARLGTDALASSSLAGAAGSRFLDCQQMRRTALATARTQAPLRSALCGGNAAGSRERDWLSCFVARSYPRRQSWSRSHPASGAEPPSLPLGLVAPLKLREELRKKTCQPSYIFMRRYPRRQCQPSPTRLAAAWAKTGGRYVVASVDSHMLNCTYVGVIKCKNNGFFASPGGCAAKCRPWRNDEVCDDSEAGGISRLDPSLDI